jgi:hypothetical protein
VEVVVEKIGPVPVQVEGAANLVIACGIDMVF